MIINSKDMFGLNFFKKGAAFTGSNEGTRYLVRMVNEVKKDEIDPEKEIKISLFEAFVWPEPLNFASTPEEKKTMVRFPFSEEGLVEVTDWLNENSGHKEQ